MVTYCYMVTKWLQSILQNTEHIAEYNTEYVYRIQTIQNYRVVNKWLQNTNDVCVAHMDLKLNIEIIVRI